jgi:hypothetical protein
MMLMFRAVDAAKSVSILARRKHVVVLNIHPVINHKESKKFVS